jgi:hypothetical protein
MRTGSTSTSRVTTPRCGPCRSSTRVRSRVPPAGCRPRSRSTSTALTAAQTVARTQGRRHHRSVPSRRFPSTTAVGRRRLLARGWVPYGGRRHQCTKVATGARCHDHQALPPTPRPKRLARTCLFPRDLATLSALVRCLRRVVQHLRKVSFLDTAQCSPTRPSPTPLRSNSHRNPHRHRRRSTPSSAPRLCIVQHPFAVTPSSPLRVCRTPRSRARSTPSRCA